MNIERLPYDELVNHYNSISDLNKKYVKELESWKRVAAKNFNRAEDYKSIIKEVREYIEEAKTSSQEVENDWAVDICNMVLEILDKVGDIK